MALRRLKSAEAGTEGADEVRAGIGAVDVEGGSGGLVLARLAPLIETVRSSGFQQFFLI